jgi:small-conductance mechanosensitive channel
MLQQQPKKNLAEIHFKEKVMERIKLKKTDLIIVAISLTIFLLFLYFFYIEKYAFYAKYKLVIFKIFFLIVVFFFLKGVFGILSYITKNTFEKTKDKNILLINSILKTLLSIYFVFIFLLVIFGSLEALSSKISTILAALGIFSALLIFAFQQPILNLLGWFTLITRRYYSIGDRIKISFGTEEETIIGDVLEINLLTTKIRKLNKDFEPVGAVAEFPNQFIITKQITNYSVPTENIWDEIVIKLKLTEKNLEKLDEIKKVMLNSLNSLDLKTERAKRFFDLFAEYEPKITVLLEGENIILKLRYLVNLKDKAEVKTKLSENIAREIGKLIA